MIETERLTVSLTKNGYLKIASLVKHFPRWQILENLDGTHANVRLVESQVANILSRDPVTDEIPAMWDEIKEYGELAIESFTLLAVMFSHHKLITLFRETSQGKMRGCIQRGDLTEKEYTNLIYAMSSLRLCKYVKGAESVNYNLSPLVANLNLAGSVVRKLIESKLGRCGWLDPERVNYSTDGDFFAACRTGGLIGALGMTQAAFKAWIEGTSVMDSPEAERPARPR
jgi:hypothetical protein